MAHERSPYGVAVDLEQRADRHPDYQREGVSHTILAGKPAASQDCELNGILAALAIQEHQT